ncbi:hypothetical protein HW114_04530 [Serratia symbiotica]|uniref:hypothetical protein n=1 Tax=Serratia symbiotica TaxID=138074 RepID=UPI0018882A88|nr:hypothetical protein [Serratia symbiotica]MBF1994833.1 hypothetical protein [Serratia symbiotica]
MARSAGLPLVPVVASHYYLDFRLNRLNNGKVVIKFMLWVSKETITSQPVRDVVAAVHQRKEAKLLH